LTALATYDLYKGSGHRKQSLFSNLKIAQPSYDWYLESGDRLPKEATSKWDDIQQKLECCGVEASSDWNDFRPKNLAKDVLPESCCTMRSRAHSTDGLCHFEHAFETGCESQYHNKAISLLMPYFMLSAFFLSLAALAFYVAKPKHASCHSANAQRYQFERSLERLCDTQLQC
jgi:hypothetical protein